MTRDVTVTAIHSETGDLGAQEYQVTLVARPSGIRQVRPEPSLIELPADVREALDRWLNPERD